jgi:hypothetical protein
LAIRKTADGRKRSVAWLYYAVIAVVLVIFAVSTVLAALLPALLAAAYSLYLYRGGRFVLWLW